MNEQTLNAELNGLMDVEQADSYMETLPLKNTVRENAWKGKVAFTLNGDNEYDLLRLTDDDVSNAEDNEDINPDTGLPFGMYDASCADSLIKDMLFEAFTTGNQIFRWALFQPEVCDKLIKADTALSNRALKTYIDSIDDLEVSLYAAGKKWKAPRVSLWKTGSKPSKSKQRIVRRAR